MPGKLIGIVLVVLAIWIGISVYTEGMDRALGGWLGRLVPASAQTGPPDARAPLDRVRDATERARHEQLDRVQRQLAPGERGEP